MIGLEVNSKPARSASDEARDPQNSREVRAPIEVAIVCAPGTVPEAEAVAALLSEEGGFSCRYFGDHLGSGLTFRESRQAVVEPDVVIVLFGSTGERVVETLLARVGRRFPGRSVLAMLRETDAFGALKALEKGASDFVFSPVRRPELVTRVISQAPLACRHDLPFEDWRTSPCLREIIGESPGLLQQVGRVPRFARSDASVLICGESGTGKELFAKAIHGLSKRASRPFVALNCAAIPEHLVESEIFGHKRGAFTGAIANSQGLIHESDGGTLFLDEVDSLTCQAQVKLLRFLQEGECRAVGSLKTVRANVRVVAAASSNFAQSVQQKRFRADLFYRLNVLQITLPPLRERRADIPLLVRHFLDREACLRSQPAKTLSPVALDRVLSYSWPGNIRELQNALTRALLLSDHRVIQVIDLNLPDDEPAGRDASFQSMKSEVIARFEREFLQTALTAHEGNITQAARAVKKNRRAFWQLLRKHKLLRTHY
jgi:two-component system response regulator GlrR